MKITKRYSVPTGDILVAESIEGMPLEFVSLADYGKDVNLKADFLGLTREPMRVEHVQPMPLSEKWVVTISTQYGCSMGCRFCDVPRVGRGKNIGALDLMWQIISAVSLHPEIRETKRLNIHYARMGEPTFNPAVLGVTRNLHSKLEPYIHAETIHPVVSTMMPRDNKNLEAFLTEWMYLKNGRYGGEAGLQLSINSTNDKQREKMFNGNSLSLGAISYLADKLPYPLGRKITLNFALAGYTIQPKKLAKMFDPDKFVVKLTPMHRTQNAVKNKIETRGDAASYTPYAELEAALKDAGFDVLVFLASDAEDMSKITCGNAVLASGAPVLPADIWEET